MEYRTLGPTALKVSALGLGCNSLGLVPDEDARDIILRALDLGITFFDTADVYADGRSEEALGRHLAGRRAHVMIATKFGHPSSVSPPSAAGSRNHIVSALERSLRRLRTDWVDLYQMHFPDPNTPIEETLRALDDLIRQGKVRHIGCSNFSVSELLTSLEAARDAGIASFVTCQAEYNLIARNLEAQIIPTARQWRLGIIPCFPLAGGLLTGKYDLTSQANVAIDSVRSRAVRRFAERFLSRRNLRMAAQLQAFASARGWNLAAMSIAWLLANPSVCSVIAGASHERQLDQNARALDLVLDPAQLAEIAAVLRAIA